MERSEYVDALVLCIQNAERAKADELMASWAAGQSFGAVLTELLTPALEVFGRVWANSGLDVSLAQGYVAAKIAEDLLAKIAAERQRTGQPPQEVKGPVVLGNIQDDYHPLGRKMVASFLRMEGWDVCDLGVDVSPGEFVDQAENLGARIVGASAMMYTTAKNIANLREEIERRNLGGRIQLAVGGAVFKLRPELVREFGGDGTVAHALGASALFDLLWECSLQREAK